MSTSKQFRHSQLAELGKITRKGELNYHYRSVSMADGSVGLFYGDEGEGPEDPCLLILDYLMDQGETVQYYVRPNANKDGNIMWINIDKKEAAARLAKFKSNPILVPPLSPVPAPEPKAAVIAPPSQEVSPPAANTPGIISPPANKVIPPSPEPIAPFPTQAPPEELKSGGKGPLADDPWLGYGSRDAMFRAKDGHFERMERYKIARDVILDREYSFRHFHLAAIDIVSKTGKSLQPSAFSKTAWDLAIVMYNDFRNVKYNEGGQIVNDGSEKSGEPA